MSLDTSTIVEAIITGTGFAVSKDGLIVTASHLIKDMPVQAFAYLTKATYQHFLA